ncbi:MAG: DUF433 domain-containing protein [Planctomycetaceae bacterium]|nr:DUF433 domain-containing protein [Planctomycetaceae bacterium]
MNLLVEPVPVPLFDDGHGGLRVANSRVLLERVIHAFDAGATPEGIVQSYDTLRLPDVYAVLSWYLQHRTEVGEYLREREAAAEAFRRQIEGGQSGLADLRSRLLARRASEEVVHGPTGQ